MKRKVWGRQFIGPYNAKKKHIQMDVLLFGAASQIWTGDLILTKDALYRLSYSSI